MTTAENPPDFLIAVDPGASGGLAWFEPGTGVQAVSMPDGDAALLERCRALAVLALKAYPLARLRVGIELVGGFVKPPKLTKGEDGEAEIEGGQPGSAMFKFGENAWLVRGMFLALGADVELIPPQVWQGPLFIRKRGRAKEEWKRDLKAAAQRRFPGLKVTLKTADALLILSFMALKAGRGDVIAPGNPQTGQGGARSAGKRRISGKLKNYPLPDGAYFVTDGTTFSGDLVWNKDRRGWDPVDAVNEYVSEYIAVCRNIYTGEWKGVPCVFRRMNGRTLWVRKANPDDVANLKTLPR